MAKSPGLETGLLTHDNRAEPDRLCVKMALINPYVKQTFRQIANASNGATVNFVKQRRLKWLNFIRKSALPAAGILHR